MKKFKEVVSEVRLLKMGKDEKVTGDTVIGKALDAVKTKGKQFETIPVGDHTIWFNKDKFSQLYVVNRNGIVDGYLAGEIHNGVLTIDGADSNGRGPKMPDIYSEILRKGWADAITSDAIQSVGGQRIWQKLAKQKGIVVHGWDDLEDKPLNVDLKSDDDEEDVWVDGDELTNPEKDERGKMAEPETTQALNTRLVALLTRNEWEKLHPRYPKNDLMRRGGQFKHKVG
jgi:hypothetical protein